jgi:hypothetical protein
LQAAGIVTAARELGQRAAAQVAHEHVAVAHECAAHAGRIEDNIGGIEVGACAAFQSRLCTAVDADLPGVADGRAVALEQVLRGLAIPTPPAAVHRRPDPVRIRHRLGQRDRFGGMDHRRGDQGREQGEGERGKAHGAIREAGRQRVAAVPAQASAGSPAQSVR